jgi:hypothetical protein
VEFDLDSEGSRIRYGRIRRHSDCLVQYRLQLLCSVKELLPEIHSVRRNPRLKWRRSIVLLRAVLPLYAGSKYLPAWQQPNILPIMLPSSSLLEDRNLTNRALRSHTAVGKTFCLEFLACGHHRW